MEDKEKQSEDFMVNPNLSVFNKVRQVPQSALKQIGAGRLKGMSDVNPLWRIMAMTDTFGICGIGWKYEIIKQWTETYGNEIKGFCNINLYVKVDGSWSDAIPGTGGSSFVTIERNGAYVNDECVDGDCEVLTKTGWVKFKDYDGISEIAQFNKDTDEISFVKPIRFIHKISADLYDKGGFIMTANHRNLVYSRNKNERIVKYAHELAELAYRPSKNGYGRSGNYRDVKCGKFGNPQKLSILQRIGIMLACDGTKYYKTNDAQICWRVEFSKKRKIEDAETLLNSLGVSYRKKINKRKDGTATTSFAFNLSDGVDYKQYEEFIPLGNYTDLWDEIVSWDGCDSRGVETFCTTNKKNALYLQTLLVLSNEVVTCHISKRNNPLHKDVFHLYRKRNETGMVGTKKYDGTMEVYCVEVPTTFFLIRKDLDILVTGNCFKMALTDALSVAMKSLGVAADIYFAKGADLGTKYAINEQAANGQLPTQQSDPNLELTIANVKICSNIDDLEQIWKECYAYQKNKLFISAVSNRKKELEKV